VVRSVNICCKGPVALLNFFLIHENYARSVSGAGKEQSVAFFNFSKFFYRSTMLERLLELGCTCGVRTEQ